MTILLAVVMAGALIFVAYVALFWFCASSLYGDELSPGGEGGGWSPWDRESNAADQRSCDVK